jgi:hypothetical protein
LATTLDNDISKPAQSEPGDGPADTTDPLERASTVVPRPGPEALRAGTVNSQLPLEPIPAAAKRSGQARTEEYDAVDANGRAVRVKRNLETGESRIVESTATGSTPTQASGR